jgi:hypothetical protein
MKPPLELTINFLILLEIDFPYSPSLHSSIRLPSFQAVGVTHR